MNACERAKEYQIYEIEEAKGLEALVEVIHGDDLETIIYALDGIENILMRGEGDESEENKTLIKFNILGGQNRLDELMMHSNDIIAEKTKSVMEKFYAIDDLEEIQQFRKLGLTSIT